MSTVTLEQAQSNLSELIANLESDGEVVIAENGTPVAKLMRIERTTGHSKAGCYKKDEFWMASDFGASLDEFKEYME